MICLKLYTTIDIKMKIISFDIGLKTCSICVEEYKDSSLQAPKVKYLKGGEATEDMKAHIKQVALLGRVVHLEKRELGNKVDFFANRAYKKLYEWCGDLAEHLSTANIILIEQQMKCNNIALALMYHLQAFLLIHYPDTQVVLYPSKNKTRVLGAPLKAPNKQGIVKKVTKYQRKKWSTECADIILKQREQFDFHDYIFKQNKSKKDDLSDVIMQTLSYVVSKTA